MAARDEVLARIGTALGNRPAAGTSADGAPATGAPASGGPADGSTADGALASDTVPRGYRSGSGLDTSALIGLLTERLRDYGTRVRRCTPAGALAAVSEALADRGARRIVVPRGLDLPGLDATGLGGITLLTDGAPSPGAPSPGVLSAGTLSADELDGADGVITTAALAIAETGTIVLDGGPGQGRRALSLVPDYHLCILHAGQIVGIVPEALARLDPGRPCTWISGPSATSDIELDRVQGVHGPRTLEVILIEP
jgi:L-lactate dehydrogenase complex protein LldG